MKTILIQQKKTRAYELIIEIYNHQYFRFPHMSDLAKDWTEFCLHNREIVNIDYMYKYIYVCRSRRI